jgi:amidophosphoribosyltransferase
MTVFDLAVEEVKEVQPGHVVVIKRRGTISEQPFTPPLPKGVVLVRADLLLARQRRRHLPGAQALGGRLADQVLRAIGHNWADTVFSFIPNTAEVAYYGLMSALRTAARRGQGGDPQGEPEGG